MSFKLFSGNLRKNVLFAIFFILNLNGCSMGRENMDKLYFIQVDVVDAKCDIRLNGASIVKDKAGAINVEKQVNKWMRSGENVVEVNLISMKKGEGVLGRAKVILYIHDESHDFPTPKSVLVNYVFPNEDYLDGDEFKERISFEADEAVSAKIFNDAESVALVSGEDKNKIFALIEQLREALVSGNYKKAVELQKYKIEEDARIEGVEEAVLFAAAEESFQLIGKENNVRSAPLLEENAVIEGMWGNKVFMVVRKDGDEAIAIESDDLSFAIPIYVSKVAGEWKIVR